ncbi:MAG: hypothetical protein JXN60_02140 [Lentisphaerae bacterium]|nr:hypothetical protein [Lentisphaerota bacterium]
MMGLRIPFANWNIVFSFQIYHLALLLIGVYLWNKIADELLLSLRGRWLGFCGLFVNFAMLKWVFYYPVLTDLTSYVLGLFLVYFFLKRNQIGILMILILGFFTWPNFFEIGVVLLIFPKSALSLKAARFKLNTLLAIAASACVLVGSLYIFYSWENPWGNSVPIETSVIPLSIVLMATFTFYVVKALSNAQELYTIKSLVTRLDFKWSTLGVLTFLGLQLLLFLYARQLGDITKQARYNTVLQAFVRNLLFLGNKQPFIFFIAHVLFFGPIILLAFLFWKRCCHVIHAHGPGLTLFVALGLLLSLNAESRTLVNLFPFFAVFTVKALEQFQWKSSYYLFIAFVSFIFSKVWLLINAAPTPDPNAGVAAYLEFPWQKLFMNSGYLVSGLSYITQGSAVLLTGIVFYFMFVHISPRPDQEK